MKASSTKSLAVKSPVALGFDLDLQKRTEAKLSLYDVPPVGEVVLEDLEVHAVKRLSLLRSIERTSAGGGSRIKMYETIRKGFVEFLNEFENKDRIDDISHHIVRLCFCGTSENSQWFITYETMLFRARLNALKSDEIVPLLKILKIECNPVDVEEKSKFSKELIAVGLATETKESLYNSDLTTYYKVDFEEVFDLVRARRVFLHEGTAYVTASGLTEIVVDTFKKKLASMMEQSRIHHSRLVLDDRLNPLLKGLPQAYSGPSYTGSGDKISHKEIDDLAKSAFPLCMQHMHEHLKQRHHLKHQGRLEYGLFLKGLGVSLEDSLEFWRREFGGKMSADEFMKNYAYNIRHSYGMEGKRSNYSAYSCQKIIGDMRPGPDEAHGCPYKTLGSSALRQVLARKGITDENVLGKIADHVSTGNYQLACKEQFMARFRAKPSESNDNEAQTPDRYDDDSLDPLGSHEHPNGYALAAMRILKRRNAKKNSINQSQTQTQTQSQPQTQSQSQGESLKVQSPPPRRP